MSHSTLLAFFFLSLRSLSLFLHLWYSGIFGVGVETGHLPTIGRRWLTHSISDYYGLDSKSVMVGNPARRVIYVGVKQKQKQTAPRQRAPNRPLLPPPLWEMF